MIFSPILFREKLTWPKMAGFLAVLVGMLCVNSLALREVNTTVGLFCGIMSAVMYAFMVIFNKKAKSITGLENAMWQLLISFLTVAVFVGIKQGLVIHIESGNWVPILILGGAVIGELFRSQNPNFHSLLSSQIVSQKPLV